MGSLGSVSEDLSYEELKQTLPEQVLKQYRVDLPTDIDSKIRVCELYKSIKLV